MRYPPKLTPMESSDQSPPATRRNIRILAALLTVVIWGAYVLWRRDDVAALGRMTHVATPVTSIPFAVVLGYGLASILGLLHANWHRLRAVFRPNLGRIIGTLALVFVTPFVIYDWFPWIVGGFVLVIIQDPRVWLIIITKGWPLALWYIPSCLIISGTKSKWLRFGLFCLMFWSAYSALALMFGVRHFTGF